MRAPFLGAVAFLIMMLATGCGNKTNEAATTAPASAVGAASITTGGAPVPGNPNPNAAANAAAFEAARKKAEGR